MFHVLSPFFIERIYNRQMCRYTCECPPIGWFCWCKILGLTNVDPRDLAEIWCLLSCDIGKAGDRNRITHPFLAAGQGRWHAPNHHRGQLRAARGETRVAAARSPGSSLCWLPDPCPSVSRGNNNPIQLLSCRSFSLYKLHSMIKILINPSKTRICITLHIQ